MKMEATIGAGSNAWTVDSAGVYEKLGKPPMYFNTPDGKRFLAPAMYHGEVVGLRPAGPSGSERYVDGVGTKWLVQEWQSIERCWSVKQAEEDWSPMPELWQFRAQFTPEGQPKRYIADCKHYVFREYPIENGGFLQIAVRTDEKWASTGNAFGYVAPGDEKNITTC